MNHHPTAKIIEAVATAQGLSSSEIHKLEDTFNHRASGAHTDEELLKEFGSNHRLIEAYKECLKRAAAIAA